MRKVTLDVLTRHAKKGKERKERKESRKGPVSALLLEPSYRSFLVLTKTGRRKCYGCEL